MNEAAASVVRRAIVDLLAAIGGEQNDSVLTTLLNADGHGLARRDVADALRWLGEQGLAKVETLGSFVVGEVLPDGIDVADGRLRFTGVSRHRSAAAAGTARR